MNVLINQSYIWTSGKIEKYLEIFKTQYLVKMNSDNGYSINNLMDISVDTIFSVHPA